MKKDGEKRPGITTNALSPDDLMLLGKFFPAIVDFWKKLHHTQPDGSLILEYSSRSGNGPYLQGILDNVADIAGVTIE